MNGLSMISVEYDDWFVLYVEGKKTFYDGHGLRADDIINAINDYIKENSKGSHLHSISGINFETWNVSEEYVDENGDNFPVLLSDIPESAFE